MDVRDHHRRALDAFTATVTGVSSTEWHQPTPCREWDVRALVNHVVGENRWMPPLLGGATIAEVGDSLDGDLLGDDPIAAWHDSTEAALGALDGVERDGVVHLSFGDTPVVEYLWQLTADALVHAWDLARATGQPESLPTDVVEAVAGWFDTAEEAYRSAGAVGPPVAVEDPDPQAVLLARFGRNPSPDDPLAAVARFNRAFGSHDLNAIGAAITDDCTFVDTTPPNGTVHEGRDAVLAAFEDLFTATPSATFDVEGGFVGDDQAAIRWRYTWDERGGGHVHGVDVFRLRGGKVAEKLSYVKG